MSGSIRVGVLGGGQLGRMLALAGYPLGIRLKHMGSPHDTSASEVAEQVDAEYSDQSALQRFAHGVSVITYEWENVPLEAVRVLNETVPVYPSARALEVAQDRLPEKQFFQRLGIRTAPFAAIDSFASMRSAIERVGLPSILKTRRMGYDGKGQVLIQEAAQITPALKELGGADCILEGIVRFERELSVIAVRSVSGEVRVYPLVENAHAEGILRRSIAPAPDAGHLQALAEGIATNVLRALDYVGVLAIELFQVGGELIANEMAPRVHNSGHWTIEGAETSQFENHLRAILDLPLGSTAAIGHSVMLNLIGAIPDARTVLQTDNAHLHLYGKTARPGRKVGHITVRDDTAAAAFERAERLRKQLDGV